MVDHNPVTIKGKDATTGLPTDIVVIGGATSVETKQHANENFPADINAYGSAIPKWKTAIVTADTVVCLTPCLVGKVSVTLDAATATAAIEIRDSVTAGTGTVMDTLPIGTAAGTVIDFDGASFSEGLVIDYGVGATGTIRVNYWPNQASDA